MISRTYIGEFEEISSLSEREQSELLEQARYEIFVTQGYAKRTPLYIATFLLAVVALPLILLILGFALVIAFLVLPVILAISLYLHFMIHRSLVKKGLGNVLENRRA